MLESGNVAALVAPRKLETMKYKLPEVKKDSLLLEIAATGICGSDVIISHRADEEPFKSWFTLPTVLGHEIVGRVYEMGDKVEESMRIWNGPLKRGDRVVVYDLVQCHECWWERTFGSNFRTVCMNPPYEYHTRCDEWPHFVGGFGEYMYIHPKTNLFKIPENIPWKVAVLTEPFSIGIRAIERAMSFWGTVLPYNGTIVVQGSGTIGLLTAVAARILGAGRIIITGGPKNRLKLAEELGIADYKIDISEKDVKERIKEVKKLTPHGLGADIVVECAGAPLAVVEGLEMLRPYGTLVEVGNLLNFGQTIEFSPAKLVTTKNVAIIGVGSQPPHYFEKSLKAMQNYISKIPFEKIVTHTFRVEDAKKAFQMAEELVGLKVAITGPAWQSNQ